MLKGWATSVPSAIFVRAPLKKDDPLKRRDGAFPTPSYERSIKSSAIALATLEATETPAEGGGRGLITSITP